ncbi:MAG: TIGR02757 family protein [Rhodothermaeota bacterium MED-G64]|nr:MAG: TIGR02757 family protein [Rhodothermaeota bacterium MED-G64]
MTNTPHSSRNHESNASWPPSRAAYREISSYCALSKPKLEALKPWLDNHAALFEEPRYIENDPIGVVVGYEEAVDREIVAFLAAMMAWGRREIVIQKTLLLMENLGPHPALTLRETSEEQWMQWFASFRHRTFNVIDIVAFLRGLKVLLQQGETLETIWKECFDAVQQDPVCLMSEFQRRFRAAAEPFPKRTSRHISTPESKTASKRLWMYLRWMVRSGGPVDLGQWTFISPSQLRIPLDVHVGRQSRRLGLLKRKANDALAVEQLTSVLRYLDPLDPVKYDYAFLGIGIEGESL